MSAWVVKVRWQNTVRTYYRPGRVTACHDYEYKDVVKEFDKMIPAMNYRDNCLRSYNCVDVILDRKEEGSNAEV